MADDDLTRPAALTRSPTMIELQEAICHLVDLDGRRFAAADEGTQLPFHREDLVTISRAIGAARPTASLRHYSNRELRAKILDVIDRQRSEPIDRFQWQDLVAILNALDEDAAPAAAEETAQHPTSGASSTEGR